MAVTGALERMRGGLVVSVQAAPGSPLAAPEHLAAIARAVEAGGAVGIRTEGIAAIRAIRAAVDVPVIGLVKRRTPGTEVYITPDVADALAVAEAGADLVAVDATERPRLDGTSGPEFVAAASAELPGMILADVDSVERRPRGRRGGRGRGRDDAVRLHRHGRAGRAGHHSGRGALSRAWDPGPGRGAVQHAGGGLGGPRGGCVRGRRRHRHHGSGRAHAPVQGRAADGSADG